MAKRRNGLTVLMTLMVGLIPVGLTACGDKEGAVVTESGESVMTSDTIPESTDGSTTATEDETTAATSEDGTTTSGKMPAAKTTAKTTPTTESIPPASAAFTLEPGHKYLGHVVTLFEFPVQDTHTIVQGGTFDGTHYYVAMIDKDASPETSYLLKFDIKGNLIKKSDKMVLDHANDITYVKKWNALLVSHCQSNDGHFNRYSLVDPETFAITKTEDLPNPFFGMDYCVQRDSFVSARWRGETIDLWNGDLSHRQSFSVKEPEGTSQGVAADADYLYFARYNANSVQVYDWDGKHMFAIPLDMTGGEPEHISIVDGVMYIGGNNSTWTGGYVAYVELEDVTG